MIAHVFVIDLELSPDSADLHGFAEVRYLLQFGTSSTRAGGQDDVSSNQLHKIKTNEVFIFCCGWLQALFCL